ncbi:MAG: FG-GAP-like repeat-containing protein [Planctomycetota bacterium]
MSLRNVVSAAVFTALSALAAGGQQFVNQGALPGPVVWSEGVEAFDANGDGWLDLIFTNGVGFNSAGGALPPTLLINQAVPGAAVFADETAARIPAGFTQQGKGLTTCDVDGDGDEDIVFANAFLNQPRILINDGTGNFTDQTATRFPAVNLGSFGVAAGDLDDDGDLDLVFCDTGPSQGGGQPPRLFLNDGTGTFTDEPTMMNGVNKVGAMMVSMVDIDGDLDLDVIVDGKSSGQHLYLNDGTANFTFMGTTLPAGTGGTYETDWADLDLDGDIDGAYVSFGGGAAEGIAVNNSVPPALSFGGSTNILSGSNGNDDNEVAFVDYDNDGDLDLLVASLAANQEKVYTNGGGPLVAGAFSFAGGTFSTISDSTLDLTIGDFDNDGDFDVATAQGESGSFTNRYYLNNGPADTVPPMIGRVTSLDATVLESKILPQGLPIRAWVQDGSYDSGRTWTTAQMNVTSTNGAFSQSITVPMTYIGGGHFRALLVPPVPAGFAPGTTVTYSVTATDRAGNSSTSAPKNFLICGDSDFGPNTGVNDLVLSLSSPAITNALFTIDVSNANPNADGYILANGQTTSFPAFGGTFLLPLANLVILPIFTDAGGNFSYPIVLPAAYEGQVAYLQAIVFDPSKPQNWGLSQGLASWICGPQFAPPTISGLVPPVATAGTSVTITGTEFQSATVVNVGGTPVTPTSITSTQIVFTMPATSGCDTPVQVVNPDGQIAATTINPAPVVTNTIFASGPAAGGVNFIVIGTGFGAGTTATIGGVPATVTTAGATSVVMLTPPGPVGPATVVLTNPLGCTATTTYTYQ